MLEVLEDSILLGGIVHNIEAARNIAVVVLGEDRFQEGVFVGRKVFGVFVLQRLIVHFLALLIVASLVARFESLVFLDERLSVLEEKLHF